MTIKKTAQPTIMIDLKKDLIRIHRTTLNALNNPEYVLLLVNPDTRTLCLICSDQYEKRAHLIRQNTMKGKQSYELYSKPLLLALQNVCKDWNKNEKYRIAGEIIPNKGAVRFQMADAVSTTTIKVS